MLHPSPCRRRLSPEHDAQARLSHDLNARHDFVRECSVHSYLRKNTEPAASGIDQNQSNRRRCCFATSGCGSRFTAFPSIPSSCANSSGKMTASPPSLGQSQPVICDANRSPWRKLSAGIQLPVRQSGRRVKARQSGCPGRPQSGPVPPESRHAPGPQP